jgi:hypothetical protein
MKILGLDERQLTVLAVWLCVDTLVPPNIRFDKTELGVVNHHEPSRGAGFIRHRSDAMPNGIRVERLVAVNLTSTPDEDGASSARDAGADQPPPDAWSARDD